MKRLVFCIAMLAPLSAGAQTRAEIAATAAASRSYYVSPVDSSMYQSSGDTPTMQQMKLARAIALKAEAAAFAARDGGTLSRKHMAYVRRKARAIVRSRNRLSIF